MNGGEGHILFGAVDYSVVLKENLQQLKRLYRYTGVEVHGCREAGGGEQMRAGRSDGGKRTWWGEHTHT